MIKQGVGVGGHMQLEMGCQFLPRCACGSPHPLAIKHARDKTHCPQCGETARDPGETISVPTTLGGVSGIASRALMAVGRGIVSLARKV